TPNAWTEPFGQAAAEHRLVVPRCTVCGTYRLPPTPFCFACRAQAVEWVEQSGDGEIYSFTVICHPVIPNVADALPLVAAVVELPGTGGCRLVGTVVDVDPADGAIGLPGRGDWYGPWAHGTVPGVRLA